VFYLSPTNLPLSPGSWVNFISDIAYMKSTTCTGTNGRYLEEYHTETAARIAAEEMTNGSFKPVKCSRCGYWHLAPVTTRRQCMFCTDSGLFLKDIYATREEALRTADHLKREKRVQLFPYKCPHGSGWHLTKKATKA